MNLVHGAPLLSNLRHISYVTTYLQGPAAAQVLLAHQRALKIVTISTHTVLPHSIPSIGAHCRNWYQYIRVPCSPSGGCLLPTLSLTVISRTSCSLGCCVQGLMHSSKSEWGQERGCCCCRGRCAGARLSSMCAPRWARLLLASSVKYSIPAWALQFDCRAQGGEHCMQMLRGADIVKASGE